MLGQHCCENEAREASARTDVGDAQVCDVFFLGEVAQEGGECCGVEQVTLPQAADFLGADHAAQYAFLHKFFVKHSDELFAVSEYFSDDRAVVERIGFRELAGLVDLASLVELGRRAGLVELRGRFGVLG